MRASGFTISAARLRRLPPRRAEAIEKARLLARAIGLIDRADDPAGDLPYGDQRRLEIARAMCTGPVLLCLDEPAAGLNPRESAELNALLRSSATSTAPRSSADRARHERGDGDLRPRRRARLRQRKIADGTPAEVRNDPPRSSPPISASRTRTRRCGGAGRAPPMTRRCSSRRGVETFYGNIIRR
jgi:branched-chain amino acid transport system ATP-binding protein